MNSCTVCGALLPEMPDARIRTTEGVIAVNACQCTACGTFNYTADGLHLRVAEAEKILQSRNSLLERLKELEEQKTERMDTKKAMAKSYNDDIKEIDKEMKKVLADLRE